MLLLIGLLLLGLLIWSSRDSGSKKIEQEQRRSIQRLQQMNQGWIDFVAGYAKVAKNSQEKSLVAQMLADIKKQQGGTPSPEVHAVEHARRSSSSGVVFGAQTTAVGPASATKAHKAQDIQLDNASLLLYFGAFLFVASAGLFVGFSNTNGGVKVFTVMLVTALIYNYGVWLYQNRPKLRQAGQAFAGIGVVLAPLVGVALYSYVFGQQHGVLVWLITSLFCFGLYVHALTIFRNTLMGYVLVFTFLSLFESGVGVVGVPVYFYGWGLALAGILLQLVGQLPWAKNWWPELREPTYQSAHLLLPVTLFAALIMSPQLGIMQLGVSLLLAGVFYFLEIFRSIGQEQEANAVAAHLSLVIGAGTLAYGLNQHWSEAVWAMLAVNAIQLAILLLYGGQTAAASRNRLWQNYASVLLISAVATAIVAVPHPKLLLAATIATVIIGVAVWLRQRRSEAYALAALAWMSIPYVYGQFIATSMGTGAMTASTQALLGLVALLSFLGVYLMQAKRNRNVANWTIMVTGVYGLGAVGVLLTSMFAGPLFCLAVAVAVAASFMAIAEHDKQADRAELAAISLALPLIRSWDEPQAFLLVTVVVLLVLIGLSLRYRRELLRWASTIVWLILPYALGHGGLGQSDNWSVDMYTWGYMVAMAGLVFSRAIARGTLFLSSKVPISSLMRSASMSYVAGYIAAAFIALCTSLASDHSRLQTSLVLGGVIITILVLSKYVEKRSDIIAMLPLLAQGLLFSLIRPSETGTKLEAFLLASTALAVLSYIAASRLRVKTRSLKSGPATKPAGSDYTAQAALVASFVTPAAFLLADGGWPMPAGLLTAGVLLSHYTRHLRQSAREWSGAVIAVAIMWFLGWAGVHQVQAYTHVLVALLAIYAYWRAKRGEIKESNDYLWAMLLVATVPLALQAIGDTTGSGGLYGWWLLLEQIAIMLLGMAIKRRFVMFWGLYVAVGAVLYQLRGLGYAALAVLALFLIGIAVYRLQKNENSK